MNVRRRVRWTHPVRAGDHERPSHEDETKVSLCKQCKLPIPTCNDLDTRYRARRHISISALAWFHAGGRTARPACKDSGRATRLPRCAHCPLSRPDAGPDARGLHISSRSHPAPAVAGKEPWTEGQTASRCSHETALGSKRSSFGRAARGGKAPGGRHSVDHRSGQRVPGSAERCDGCRAAHAQKGTGHRQFEIDRATEGGNQGHRKQECDRRRAGQSTGRVCTFV
jgi:hypothetical protein